MGSEIQTNITPLSIAPNFLRAWEIIRQSEIGLELISSHFRAEQTRPRDELLVLSRQIRSQLSRLSCKRRQEGNLFPVEAVKVELMCETIAWNVADILESLSQVEVWPTWVSTFIERVARLTNATLSVARSRLEFEPGPYLFDDMEHLKLRRVNRKLRHFHRDATLKQPQLVTSAAELMSVLQDFEYIQGLVSSEFLPLRTYH